MTQYTYNEVNQLLSSTNPGQSFVYDTDGNMTRGYTPEGYVFTAAYDDENRLNSLEYTDNGGVVHKTAYTYRWDGFVAGIKKYEDSTLVDDARIVRGPYLAMQERDSSNVTTSEYTWGLNFGGGIGGLLNLRQNASDFYYLFDGKGNVSSLLDSTQTQVAQYKYDAFGRLMQSSGTVDQPFRFSTKRYDAATGLSYYGFRFYAPAIERWMNRDPLGEAGGINLYGFTGGNPVNFVDPWGLLVLFYEFGAGEGIGTGGNEENRPNSSSGQMGMFFGSSNKGGSTAGTYESGGAGNILGLNLGAGPGFGAYFGDAEEMCGKGTDYSLVTPIGGITISHDSNGNWGFTVGPPINSRGWGLGVNIQEIHTTIQQNWHSVWK